MRAVSSGAGLSEAAMPAEQRRPADGYMEWTDGVINIWEVDE